MKWNGTKYIKFELVVKPGFKPFGPLGLVGIQAAAFNGDRASLARDNILPGPTV